MLWPRPWTTHSGKDPWIWVKTTVAGTSAARNTRSRRSRQPERAGESGGGLRGRGPHEGEEHRQAHEGREAVDPEDGVEGVVGDEAAQGRTHGDAQVGREPLEHEGLLASAGGTRSVMSAMEAGQKDWVAADHRAMRGRRQGRAVGEGEEHEQHPESPRLQAKVGLCPNVSAVHPLKGLATRAPRPLRAMAVAAWASDQPRAWTRYRARKKSTIVPRRFTRVLGRAPTWASGEALEALPWVHGLFQHGPVSAGIFPFYVGWSGFGVRSPRFRPVRFLRTVA